MLPALSPMEPAVARRRAEGTYRKTKAMLASLFLKIPNGKSSVHKFGLYAMLITLASLAGDFRSVRAGQLQDSAAEQKSILDIMERFHGAWNGADAAAVAALFSPDGEFVSPSGAVTSTPAEIGKLLTGEFQKKFHGTTLTTTVDTIHFVQADAALAKGTYKLMGVDVFFGNDPTNHALQACDPCTFKIGVYRPSRSSSGRPFFVF